MEASSRKPESRKTSDVPFSSGRPEERKTEISKTEGEHGKGGKTEEIILNKVVHPIGVTSIQGVEIINRHYTPSGTTTYVKNREGNYENLDVGNFLNQADLKLTFTLPYDVPVEDLVFCHQKAGCGIVNPLLHCQCKIGIGILESVGETFKSREILIGKTSKRYTIELPLIRSLPLDPFNTRFYSLRVFGLKLPEQTEVYWRIHLKVCPAENIAEVISITDSPFDVNVVQENLNTLGDRLNDLVVQPLKRRGWIPWGKKSTTTGPSTYNEPIRSTNIPSTGTTPTGQQLREPEFQQSVYSSV